MVCSIFNSQICYCYCQTVYVGLSKQAFDMPSNRCIVVILVGGALRACACTCGCANITKYET